MDLAALIDQLRRGDQSAGPILISHVAPRLLGYAEQAAPELGDVDREAIVEAAIEKAVLKIDQFDPAKGTFLTWVRAFVKNEINDWRRTHAGGPALPLTDAANDIPETEEKSEAQIERAIRRDTSVTAIVLGLPEPSQLLLRLRYADELEHPAIAEQLGITAAASRKRLQRILNEIREVAADDPDLEHLGGDQ